MNAERNGAQDTGRYVGLAGSSHGSPRVSRSWFYRLLVASVLLVLVAPRGAEARYCWSPFCQMCATLFGPLPGGVQGYSQSNWNTYTAPGGRSSGPFSVFDPTPHAGVRVIVQQLKKLGLQDSHTLYDLGCGDGRVMLAAMEATGCKSVGIELQKDVMAKAVANVKKAGSPDGLLIVQGDARKFELGGADVVFVYLFPNLVGELVKKIPATTPIVSYSHPIPGRATKRIEIDGHTLFVSGDLRAKNFRPI